MQSEIGKLLYRVYEKQHIWITYNEQLFRQISSVFFLHVVSIYPSLMNSSRSLIHSVPLRGYWAREIASLTWQLTIKENLVRVIK